SQLDPVFLLFLVGQAFTVYGVIIPAEIRDYFTDKAMGIKTMTVRLGLTRASLSSITLLSAGGLLCGAGFLLKLVSSPYPALAILLSVMVAAYAIILRKCVKLYLLSREYVHSKAQDSAAQNIIELSSNNPKWITLITQTIVFMSLVLLASKLLP
ncbi:MAG: UbiA family prenyltransferase, partial [Candidatus Bathyarchaeia archaeon]